MLFFLEKYLVLFWQVVKPLVFSLGFVRILFRLFSHFLLSLCHDSYYKGTISPPRYDLSGISTQCLSCSARLFYTGWVRIQTSLSTGQSLVHSNEQGTQHCSSCSLRASQNLYLSMNSPYFGQGPEGHLYEEFLLSLLCAATSLYQPVLQIPANSVAPNFDLNLLISVSLTFSNWVPASMLRLENGHRWKVGIHVEFTSYFLFFLGITVPCCLLFNAQKPFSNRFCTVLQLFMSGK